MIGSLTLYMNKVRQAAITREIIEVVSGAEALLESELGTRARSQTARTYGNATEQNVGKIVQIIGPVVDVEFEAGHLPAIYNALRIQSRRRRTAARRIDVIAEVEQHLGENRVRAVAMKPTDGMQRGMKAIDLGEPISVPVGPETLGRVLNVLGEPVDFPDRPVQSKERWPIHRAAADARAAVDRAEDVRDRHQGHRPARAVPAGRQDRPVRRRRRRQDRRHHGADPQHRAEARRRVGVRRRRRTHARRQRPLARVPGERRHRSAGSDASRARRWSTDR